MAFMYPAKKAIIAAAVAKVVPKDWKYSLAVRNHSTIVMTISSAPVSIGEDKSLRVNERYVVERYGANHPLVAIAEALNTGNYDNSEIMTDYFDVGHYVDISFGRWDKPFVSTLAKEIT